MQEDVMLTHTKLVIVCFMTLACCLMADVLSLYHTIYGTLLMDVARCQLKTQRLCSFTRGTS